MMRITAVARGEVQGVGYRYFITGCALAADVTGYVKNQPDGSVLLVAEGEPDALDAFVRMVKAEGDAVIHVDSLAVTTGDATGEFYGLWSEVVKGLTTAGGGRGSGGVLCEPGTLPVNP